MIALMLAMQEAAASAPLPALLDIRFDLRDLRQAQGPGDIVVRGRRRNDRLEPLPDGIVIEKGPLRAAMGLGGGQLMIEALPTILPSGVPSNRIMLSWKLKF